MVNILKQILQIEKYCKWSTFWNKTIGDGSTAGGPAYGEFDEQGSIQMITMKL